MKFEKYAISEAIKKNLAQLGFKRPTDIQFKSIPPILRGEDVLAIAQTGTGKTAAFAIPMIDRIHRKKGRQRVLGITCIVLVPTRELALQIGGVFAALSKHTRVKAFPVIGGVEQDAQIARLQEGIDVLIATPGRMFDLIHQGFIRLDSLETLILDEADHMLDMGFIKDIQSIKRMLHRKHQTLFFSATINPEIKKLAFSQVKSTAIRISISPDDPVAANVSHAVLFVEMDDKRFFLERFIKEHWDSKILVFVRTRVRAERVARAMERVGIEALTIHGEKDQEERSLVLSRFKDGTVNLLIATDVSARGIDIPDVNYVINYDLPDKAENYVHRVGRTGRGSHKWVALSFCSTEEKVRLEEIRQFLNREIEVVKIGKNDYDFTLTLSSRKTGAEALIEEHEAWIRSRRRKNPE